jgi:hypothetical protein
MGMHVVYRKLRMQVCRRKHLPRCRMRGQNQGDSWRVTVSSLS